MPEPPAGSSEHAPQDLTSWSRLLLSARRGNSTALDRLFERCRPALLRRARKRLPNWARDRGVVTNDIVQDSLLRTLAPLSSFTPRYPGVLRSYLRRVVDNQIRDKLRKLGREPHSVVLRDGIGASADPVRSADFWIQYGEAVGRLKVSDRRLVVGRLEFDYSIKELAHMDGRREDAVAKALERALVRLARLMDE